jgi:N-acetyl-D-muramate 6-phosphate phosphatase
MYVGDHWRDIECGRRAGAITVAAAYGYIDLDDNVDNWQADYRVEHAREIWGLIEHLQMPNEPERTRNP